MKKYILHPNFMGLALLTVSFFVSLWIVLRQTGTIDRLTGSEVRVVRFLHWQLEPGFREALQEVIDKYNNLPHVREAGFMVQQIAISERFYPQFLNVHLISGTAPDLSTRGKAALSSQIDQFFEPLGEFVEQPNPFNTEETVPLYLDPEIRHRLIHGPWRDTPYRAPVSASLNLPVCHPVKPHRRWASLCSSTSFRRSFHVASAI